MELNCPVLLDGMSGLARGGPDFAADLVAALYRTDFAKRPGYAGYEIDGMLRIGGVPTHRIWRDLEYQKEGLKSVPSRPFPYSGLSWSRWVVEGPG